MVDINTGKKTMTDTNYKFDVAEPVIREWCAKIAEKSFGIHVHYAVHIAAAIREGGKDG